MASIDNLITRNGRIYRKETEVTEANLQNKITNIDNQITNIDNQITRLQAEKTELEARKTKITTVISDSKRVTQL